MTDELCGNTASSKDTKFSKRIQQHGNLKSLFDKIFVSGMLKAWNKFLKSLSITLRVCVHMYGQESYTSFQVH